MSNHPIEIDDAVFYCTPSKSKQKEAIDRINNAIDEGTIDPIQTLVKLRFMEGVIKANLKHVQKYAVGVIGRSYSSKEDVSILGADLKMKESGVKYNYDECNDPIYFELKRLFEERCNYLKSLKGKTEIVIEETGEVINIFPPIRTSTTIVEVKLGK